MTGILSKEKKNPKSATTNPLQPPQEFHISLNRNTSASSSNGVWAAACYYTVSFFPENKVFHMGERGTWDGEFGVQSINWGTKRKGKNLIGF